ncbi:hypothetical protein [Caniella muris]|uniref:hypothetical protein n=1 Tax=Caniella muris TaxID=2941502 RepID=UPI00203DC41A|nr:hypothetical protein [Caniella muris]
MATTPNLDEYLASLGFDPDAEYDVPEDPADAALAGVEAFVREHGGGGAPESIGTIHIAGPSVSGHSAPMRTVGDLLVSFQGAIDAIGAALSGFRSARGAIPSSISGRTGMSVVASPARGSVVIEVSPSLPRADDLRPDGDGLFDVEGCGVRPLADQAFTEFSRLVGDLRDEDPYEARFIDHLTDLGPRVASALKGFCEVVGKGAVDLDLDWSEPNGATESAAISHDRAARAARVISEAKIDNEEAVFEGTLVTVTRSPKDRLRVVRDDGSEAVVSMGDIPPESTVTLHPGERVRLVAERRVGRSPGGHSTEKLVGKSVEAVSRIDR